MKTTDPVVPTTHAEALQHYEAYALFWARRFARRHPGIPLDDFKQESRIGLVRAVDSWRAFDGGAGFKGYARTCIIRALRDFAGASTGMRTGRRAGPRVESLDRELGSGDSLHDAIPAKPGASIELRIDAMRLVQRLSSAERELLMTSVAMASRADERRHFFRRLAALRRKVEAVMAA